MHHIYFSLCSNFSRLWLRFTKKNAPKLDKLEEPANFINLHAHYPLHETVKSAVQLYPSIKLYFESERVSSVSSSL